MASTGGIGQSTTPAKARNSSTSSAEALWSFQMLATQTCSNRDLANGVNLFNSPRARSRSPRGSTSLTLAALS